ncbi:ANL family adenylate-forming protein [Cysteiniphilum litorale]|uniref:ANL family adenylate-forming protein n=1 Tax=Cysteiniphilum litorale TaxID=2056700 RepID=UPI003F884ED2
MKNSWLINRVIEYGSQTAIVHNSEAYTYADLFALMQKFKIDLVDNGVHERDVIMVLSDYSLASIALLLALYENNNIIVPVTTSIVTEVDARIEESYCDKVISIIGSDLHISDRKSEGKHELIITLQKEGCSGLILFSSGSTGKPKAMVHNFDNLVNHYQAKKAKQINMILFLMFDHIGGLNTLLNILAMGATMIIPSSRDAEHICELVQDYNIRVLPASPTFLNLILMSEAYKKYDLSSLRMITYGTESMPDSLLLSLKKVFPKVKLLQTFGTSETGIANTSSKSSDSTYMKIDDPDLQYKIVEGELWLKSTTQVMGYLNASMDSFTNDGWFKTGDLVEDTGDGYIKITGRSKEVINVGGEKVLPNEVESAILSIPEIKDVLVYGEKSAITGSSVVCDVVLNFELSSREVKKIIRAYCKSILDMYKIPTKVNVVDALNVSERFKKIRKKDKLY